LFVTICTEKQCTRALTCVEKTPVKSYRFENQTSLEVVLKKAV